MHIELQHFGKRFNQEWIFRNISYHFKSGMSYAITGPNGSGKSTLLQTIAGATMHSEGSVTYRSKNNDLIAENEFHSHVSIVAPYLELIEEMTANEFLLFHANFKPLYYTVEESLSLTGLSHASNKQIRYFSSGMKQRLKLAQAFFSKTSVLLLDEPTSNLDKEGMGLYKTLIQNHNRNRLVIVSSNDISEYDFCTDILSIAQYK